MIRTERGCSDGIKVETFEKGKVYSISDSLAKVFIHEMKVAKSVLIGKENRIDKGEIE